MSNDDRYAHYEVSWLSPAVARGYTTKEGVVEVRETSGISALSQVYSHIATIAPFDSIFEFKVFIVSDRNFRRLQPSDLERAQDELGGLSEMLSEDPHSSEK